MSHDNKIHENNSETDSIAVSNESIDNSSSLKFQNNRPEAIAQRKLKDVANNSHQVLQLKALNKIANGNNSPIQLQKDKIQPGAPLPRKMDAVDPLSSGISYPKQGQATGKTPDRHAGKKAAAKGLVGDMASGAYTGAMTGAIAGAPVFGGPGVAIGAAGGAVAGAAGGALKSVVSTPGRVKKGQEKAQADAAIPTEKQEKQNREDLQTKNTQNAIAGVIDDVKKVESRVGVLESKVK